MSAFRTRCRIAHSKGVEFQARGVVHIHAPIRLDGLDGPDGPAFDLELAAKDCKRALHEAAAQVQLTVTLRDGTSRMLAWGHQVDCGTIAGEAGRERPSSAGAHR